MENVKVCSRCKQTKPLREFGKVRTKWDGLNCYCRVCANVINIEYRIKHRERIQESKRLYRNSLHGKATALRWRQSSSGIFTATLNGARSRQLSLEYTRSEFAVWFSGQTQQCYYCKHSLTLSDRIKHKHGCTIDRKNNTQGYTLDNIVLCCRRCNVVKSDVFTEEQMLEIAGKYLKENET